jgi:hypothetical protein
MLTLPRRCTTAAVEPERTVTESELSADSKEVAPYQVDMGDGFSPFRRDVTWQTAAETPIRTLRTAGNRSRSPRRV